jgi:pyruvate/2-oxoglutarate dehydrogenase complex dihydrolipoamide acyltransferase (E2) component
MPIFRRPDGDLVPNLPPLRRMMPFLMPTRSESVVHHEQVVDLTKTLPFLEAWNATHEQKLTLFQLCLAAFARAFHERPGLNRFVSKGRIYQRKGVQLAFAAKQRFDDTAPIVTVKMAMPQGEGLEALAARFHAGVKDGRDGKEKQVDKEVKLGVLLPGFVLRGILGLLRTLDAWNLLPASMIDPDPMYASLFAANLGSLGIDRTYHHLFEYGTVGVFAVVGVAGKTVVVGEDGAPAVRETVSIRYTFDERVNDGFYAARSLDLVRKYVEDPTLLAQA